MAKTREQYGVQSGDQIVIKGKAVFARLDKLVEGDALAQENARRQKIGMITTDKPFRSLTIEDPEVVKGQGTPLAEFYGAEQVYTSKSTGKHTLSLESKSKFPPNYGHIQNGQIVPIPDPEKNPAQGQEVFVMITAFKPKNFNNMGSTFDSIVYGEGEIKFYEGGGAGGGLQGFGEALNMTVASPASAPAQDTAPAQEAAPAQNNEQASTNAFGAPQQNAAPEQPNAFGVQNPGAQTDNPFGGNTGQAGTSPFS